MAVSIATPEMTATLRETASEPKACSFEAAEIDSISTARRCETASISVSREPAALAKLDPPTTSRVVSSMAEMASLVSV